MSEITLNAELNAARKEFLQTIASSERLVANPPPSNVVIEPIISITAATNGSAHKRTAYQTVAQDLNSRIPDVILVEDRPDGSMVFSLNLKLIGSTHALETHLIAPLRAHFPAQKNHSHRG